MIRLSAATLLMVLRTHARLLLRLLRKEWKNFKKGPREYCWELVREHYKVFAVAMFMNLAGILLLKYFVAGVGLNKRLGEPVVGLVLFPVGWALNRFVAFGKNGNGGFKWRPLSAFAWPPMIWEAHKSLWRKLMSGVIWDACKSRWHKTTDGVLDDTERWMIKTFGFMLIGKISYQVFLTLGYSYLTVKICSMFTIGPLSILANYWVFSRKAIQSEVRLEPVTEMA